MTEHRSEHSFGSSTLGKMSLTFSRPASQQPKQHEQQHHQVLKHSLSTGLVIAGQSDIVSPRPTASRSLSVNQPRASELHFRRSSSSTPQSPSVQNTQHSHVVQSSNIHNTHSVSEHVPSQQNVNRRPRKQTNSDHIQQRDDDSQSINEHSQSNFNRQNLSSQASNQPDNQAQHERDIERPSNSANIPANNAQQQLSQRPAAHEQRIEDINQSINALNCKYHKKTSTICRILQYIIVIASSRSF